MSVNHREKPAGTASGQMRRVGRKPVRDNFADDKKAIDEAFRAYQMRRLMPDVPRVGRPKLRKEGVT